MNNINKKINSINPNLDNENSLGYNSERIKNRKPYNFKWTKSIINKNDFFKSWNSKLNFIEDFYYRYFKFNGWYIFR